MKIGFFGKLPGYGDFVQRNVSPQFTQYWDNWLLQSLRTANEQLGDLWHSKYFNGPIWRFILTQQEASATPVAGLLMPSVDKAGRCYPFAVICQTEKAVNPFVLARLLDPIHLTAEDFLISLLENERPDLDDITRVLNDIYKNVQESSAQSGQLLETKSVMELASVTEIDSLDFALGNESFLQFLVAQQNIDISIWSMGNTINANPQIRYFSGMPPADSYHSFLALD